MGGVTLEGGRLAHLEDVVVRALALGLLVLASGCALLFAEEEGDGGSPGPVTCNTRDAGPPIVPCSTADATACAAQGPDSVCAEVDGKPLCFDGGHACTPEKASMCSAKGMGCEAFSDGASDCC